MSAEQPLVQGRMEGNCIHCGVAMGAFLGTMTENGPIHNECIPAYKRNHVERCAHCDRALGTKRTILNGKKLRPECVADFKAGKPYVPPTMEGPLTKFAIGRSFFSGKNWKDRYFVLNKQNGLCYYENEDAYRAGKAPKGSVPMALDTRLVTRPTRQLHKECINQSKEMMVIFQEQGNERMLLMSAPTWQKHDEWVEVFKCYLKKIDESKDVDR